MCIWRGTKNGTFSVKSAYYLQKEIESRGLAESSSMGVRSPVWKQIWGLKIPNAEKNFLWRACHESLPTRQNLYRRKIVEDSSCPICGLEEETASHIIWQCSSARNVWCVGPNELQKSTGEGSEFLQVAEDVFAKCSEETVAQFAGIARRIWLRRNEVVHEGVFLHPNILVQRSMQAFEDFSLVWGQKEPRTLETPTLDRWNAPFMGWLKVNSDASVDKTKGWLGYGVVVRDAVGVVVAAQC
jgi:hypothetical protein